MNLLLDTQCFLWCFLSPEKLGPSTTAFILDRNNPVYFSAASGWEISIKYALKKLALPLPPAQYVPSRLVEQGMLALPIQLGHALHVHNLPMHHQDPFDRILIAQAQLEKLVLVTSDATFKKYNIRIHWATE